MRLMFELGVWAVNKLGPAYLLMGVLAALRWGS